MNTIKVIKADITTFDVDAIVNAANKTLLGGGGVDGAIHHAAGIKLALACMRLHGCKVGEAKITEGFKLKARYVIHTVGPQYKGKAEDAALLSSCYRNSLQLARQYDIHSIAFPCISTGVYGYPPEAAAKAAIESVRNWLEDNADYEIEVIFACFTEEQVKIYLELI